MLFIKNSRLYVDVSEMEPQLWLMALQKSLKQETET